MDELLIARNPDPDSTAALPAAAADGRRDGVSHLGHLAAHQSAVLLSGAADEWPDRARDRRTRPLRSCVRRGAAIDLVARPEPGEPLPDRVHHGPGPRCGLLAVAAHPKTSPPERHAPPPPGPPASPSWRSSSTPASSTPTGSPASRPRTVKRPCRAATTASPSTGGWSPRSNASPWPTSCPA